MLAILDDYLAANASPELRELITRANELFSQFEYTFVDAYYDQAIMMSDQLDMGDAVELIHDYTVTQLKHLLGLHSIQVNDETQIHTLVEMLSALTLMMVYENTQELFDTIDSADSPEEAFAELVNLCSLLDTENVMMAITEVSPFFIVKLKELYNFTEDSSQLLETVPDISNQIAKIQGYIAFRQQPNILILDSIATGMEIGLPFKNYADYVWHNLENPPTEEKEIADELIAMALLSSDGCDNPRAIITANLENYIPDPATITRISIRVSDLLLRFMS